MKWHLIFRDIVIIEKGSKWQWGERVTSPSGIRVTPIKIGIILFRKVNSNVFYKFGGQMIEMSLLCMIKPTLLYNFTAILAYILVIIIHAVKDTAN